MASRQRKASHHTQRGMSMVNRITGELHMGTPPLFRKKKRLRRLIYPVWLAARPASSHAGKVQKRCGDDDRKLQAGAEPQAADFRVRSGWRLAHGIATLSQKRPGRHPRFGGIYYWSLSIVFASATGLAVMRWEHDAYLFVLGSLAFGAASIGYAARKIRWSGWRSIHILGMSLSYTVLLTAFYVGNGPRLPLWNRLPVVVFWIGPSLIGLPIVMRALHRHAHLATDLRAPRRALAVLAQSGSSGP